MKKRTKTKKNTILNELECDKCWCETIWWLSVKCQKLSTKKKENFASKHDNEMKQPEQQLEKYCQTGMYNGWSIYFHLFVCK